MGTVETLLNYKQHLKLGEQSRKFYDFVVEYLALHDLSCKSTMHNAFDPWFGLSNDRIRKDDYSQYMDARLHQKYRIALEFCAIEAGLPSVVGYVESKNRLRPATACRFWFHGRHPHSVRWIMRGDNLNPDTIIAQGEEKQGSINIDTVENWLAEHIAVFSKVQKDQS